MTPKRYRIDSTFIPLDDIEIQTLQGMMDHAAIRISTASMRQAPLSHQPVSQEVLREYALMARDIQTIRHDLTLAWHGTTHLYDDWWTGDLPSYNPNHAKTDDESWVWQ